MKFLKILVLSLFIFVLSLPATGQPGEVCILDYNPFEIRELGYLSGAFGYSVGSPEVFEERIKSPHIFVGKVVSQATGKSVKSKKLQDGYFTPIKINIIEEIAGRLDKTTVDLDVKTNCSITRGSPEVGSEYIFFAKEISTESFNGLVSSKWSAAVDGIPKSELDKITKTILDYRNGIKQPVIVGYLIKHKPNPYWNYVNRSFNSTVLWRFPKFKNDWRIKKWEYDPEYAEPLKNVKVVIKNSEGIEIDSARTDSSGRFEFADIPKGNYVISPDVPKSYLVVGKCYLNDVQKGGVGFYVPDNGRVCDRTIRLDVAPAGKIEAEIHLDQGSWKDTTLPDIFLVGADSETGKIYRDYLVKISLERYWDFDKKLSFTNEKVMAGEYVLKIGTSLGSDIYYPGVKDVEKAKIIKIKEGETTKIDFSVSSLKDKKALRPITQPNNYAGFKAQKIAY